MLRKLKNPPSPSQRVPTAREILFGKPTETAVQEERERIFFGSIRLKNGTYKYTFSHRFDDLNRLVNGLLPQRPLRIMDVAVSSGISTLEWMDSLDQLGIEHIMVGGDSTMNGFLISIGRDSHVLTDATGYPLQFELSGHAVPNPPGKRNLLRYFLHLAILRWAVNFQLSSDKVAAGGQSWMSCKQVTLLNPRIRMRKNFVPAQDDITVDKLSRQRFDVVRATNILNWAYFDAPTLSAILINLRARLVSGGLLVVGRTHADNENHATIFRLEDSGSFCVLARLGSGSEIEGLALALPALS